MNQILMNSDNSKNKSVKQKKAKMTSNRTAGEPLGVGSVVKFFAGIILIFGLALSGSGTYALVSNIQETSQSKLPAVNIQRNGNSITMSVKCESGIRTVLYSWNDSTDVVTQGRNSTSLDVTATIPTGDNRLNISVIDSKGKQTKFAKAYQYLDRDVTEPTITLEVVSDGIKITATDDTEMDHIVYKLGNEEEVTVQADESNLTTIEKIVTVPQGQVTLTVEAIDKAQNTSTKTQEVKGATKPTINVSVDPNDASYLIIKIYDEEGLRMVSGYINEQGYQTDPNVSLNTKSYEWKQKVEHGETKVNVNAYNINGQVTEFSGTYTY